MLKYCFNKSKIKNIRNSNTGGGDAQLINAKIYIITTELVSSATDVKNKICDFPTARKTHKCVFAFL